MPHIRGEAVFVDLGGGRNVIALLAAGPRAENVNYSDSIVPGLFNVPFKDWAKLGRMRGTRDVPPSRMPTFVTFKNLNDPKSTRLVQPDEFPQVFGANVHLKDVKVEMTNERVTTAIKKKLLWWGKPLPWIKSTGPNTGIDTRPFVPGEYRLMSEQFKRR